MILDKISAVYGFPYKFCSALLAGMKAGYHAASLQEKGKVNNMMLDSPLHIAVSKNGKYFITDKVNGIQFRTTEAYDERHFIQLIANVIGMAHARGDEGNTLTFIDVAPAIIADITMASNMEMNSAGFEGGVFTELIFNRTSVRVTFNPMARDLLIQAIS